jgi:ketosteroid isomerase-like protein
MAITREFVLDFLRVRKMSDPAQLAPYLDDDVDWRISGPVDVLPQCGQRSGKAEVLDAMCRVSPELFRTREFEIDHLLVHGDYAATLGRFHATHAATGRQISFRSAHYMRFRNDKLVWYRCLIDSFDATEQIMGHELDLAHTPELVAIAPDSDLVEI